MGGYDFENDDRWKGLLLTALRKVQREVHPSLIVEEAALEYIEPLIVRLLGMLCAGQPHTVQDVEERVQRAFPHPIDQWAISDARSALEKGKKKAPLVLPVDKIHPLLKEGLGYRVDSQVSLYLVAVMEYIAADILKLAGNYVKNIRHMEICCQDIKVAMCADKVLMEMFHQDDEEVSMSSLALEDSQEVDVRTGTLTYDEVVKDMILEETQYIRDLNLIIKVFRRLFTREPNLFSEQDVADIFGNLLDIHSISVSFLSQLEDAMEMMDDNSSYPAIGECFEEIAEGEEFEPYIPYANQILSSKSRGTLNRLLARPEVARYFQDNFKDAVAYVLPKLLLEPIYHCIHYFDVLKLLLKTSPNEDDRESLRQASGALKTLQTDLEKICTIGNLPKRKAGETLRFHRRVASRQLSIQKMNEIQKNIEGWEGKDINQLCNEFIIEGNLGKVHAGKNKKANTERHIFLFDLMIVCCKQNARKSVTSSSPEYRFKERYALRKISLVDREDTDDFKHGFEIKLKEQHPPIIFFAKNRDEKTTWMEALTTLCLRSTIERMLDTILAEEEAQQPLRLPTTAEYKFAEEDSPNNIVFEEGQKSRAGVPLIKGGTLLKLIERLTYHKYADPSFVRTFLTTYRSFCKPQELLSLLIDRFEIQDPEPTEEDRIALDRGAIVVREDLKRFRKEYAQPIQLRVLNVLRHWVDRHFYDFERNPDLPKRLMEFIDQVKGKAMRKWAESIKKIVQRRQEADQCIREITFERDPPLLEWHITRTPSEFDLMTLHPIEIARQLTTLEADLFRAVQPSELVGTVWTKKDKSITSPNLLKMIHHSNMLILWLEKCIVEAENFEERVAVLSRIIEIMMVFQELNNFNGVMEVVSALNSSAIYRLEHTFRDLSLRKKQALEEAKELSGDHYKKYTEKLRSINPPCVPFVGMYLSNILFTEQGNPDFLHSEVEGLINFSKRRKVAEITGEIQQYQNQPYCLQSDKAIKRFFENLDPMEDKSEKEFNDYLYEKSLEIEPRNCKQPPKFPRKFEYPLKSPGIKPSAVRHPSVVGTLTKVGYGSMELKPPLLSTRTTDEDSTTPIKAVSGTPPSPHTPTTPSSTSDFDNSVFAQVDIATPKDDEELPPPVPPRMRIDSNSPTRPPDATEPPLLPPKTKLPQAKPPLPPRRNSAHHPPGYVSQHSAPAAHYAGGAATLPYPSSPSAAASHQTTQFDMNGSIPAVPPRIHRKSPSYPHDQHIRRTASVSAPPSSPNAFSHRREIPTPMHYSTQFESPWVPRVKRPLTPTLNQSFHTQFANLTSSTPNLMQQQQQQQQQKVYQQQQQQHFYQQQSHHHHHHHQQQQQHQQQLPNQQTLANQPFVQTQQYQPSVPNRVSLSAPPVPLRPHEQQNSPSKGQSVPTEQV
ncbi:son of sevenless homolog 1-like isoform X2 [Acanthaster planci]|uniref:Son of sevenless homolog 1-like isoform X2 n=1 Tax=Acanthaster planci TaxID=133434 RepID=A0A8B7ZJT4_ACAPL|nr:son of sevenless homolog 1-like isoform X2 [Acanthaster planci]